jgi:hypothetical protein
LKSGSRANKSGKLLETTVRRQLEGWLPGLTVYGPGQSEIVPRLERSVPYTTIYGTTGRTEFVLYLPSKRVRIECKWQAVSGSVDEKYPYTYACMSACEEDEVVILADGGGAKASAIAWLKRACAGHRPSPRMACMTLTEFCAWVQSGCPDLK